MDISRLSRDDDSGAAVAGTLWLYAAGWIPKRIWQRITVVDLGFRLGPCWLTSGWDDGKGHAKAHWQKRDTFVHRIVYHLFHGTPVFDLDTIDHLCRNRSCCHPMHLENVAHKVNTDRGLGVEHQFKKPDEYARAA